MLGQLYKQALEAKGFKVQYKENIGSTELIDASLRSGRVTLYPEYTGIMLSVTFKQKTLPKTALGTYLAREGAATRSAGRRCSSRRRSRTATGSQCSGRRRRSTG